MYIKSFGGQKGGSSEPPWTPPAYGPGLHSSLWWYNKFLFWFEGLTNRNKHWVSVYAQRNWAERVVSLLIALRAHTEFWDTLEMWIKPQLVGLFFLILVSPGIINFALSPWWDWNTSPMLPCLSTCLHWLRPPASLPCVSAFEWQMVIIWKALDIRQKTSTSHVVAYLGAFGWQLNTPFKKCETNGCCPTHLPSTWSSVIEMADLKVFMVWYWFSISNCSK